MNKGFFTGPSGRAGSAERRQGPVSDARGGRIAERCVSAPDAGGVSGALSQSPAQVEALQAAPRHVHIATESAPEGNLSGWLQR